MSIPRAKKKKKKATQRPTKTPFEIVKTTNYLNLAIAVRTLHEVNGWGKKRLGEFLESYLALMGEVADKRTTVIQAINDCYELTGYDVKKLLDEVYGE